MRPCHIKVCVATRSQVDVHSLCYSLLLCWCPCPFGLLSVKPVSVALANEGRYVDARGQSYLQRLWCDQLTVLLPNAIMMSVGPLDIRKHVDVLGLYCHLRPC